MLDRELAVVAGVSLARLESDRERSCIIVALLVEHRIIIQCALA
ncbi:MAG: hypothetical protein ACO326_09005 [Burkholderiaceae bacterium]